MRSLLTSGIFVVFCLFSLIIMAQVPQLLNYQGRLTDDAGIPIITTTTVRFSLYQGGDAATAGSGTLCYREDASVTPDDNGVFSHLIGSGTVIFGALDATVFQTVDPVFLEITIDPAGANETLLPRKQIVTVGYSFKSEVADDADTVDGQDASAFAPVVHNHDPDYVNEGQADSVTSSMIVDGTIVDADINAGANIAATKINTTGLDADLLDGKDSLAFVHTTGDDMTGTLRVTSTGATYAIYGKEESTTGTRYGVYGESVSTVLAVGVMGTSPHYGVWGEVPNTGVSNYGVYGRTYSTGGAGVMGVAENASGNANGVSGLSGNGNGVYGNGVYGVYGYSNSTSGRGVYGAATALSGTIYGVYGMSQSPDGYGVYGRNDFGGYGVYGNAWAMTGETYGVYGTSRSNMGIGVYGGVTATSGTTYGIFGTTNSSSGYAGYFDGNTHVTGNLTVDGTILAQGVKPCVQPIDDGKKVLLYAMESPEIWFEDFGTAQLVNGQAVVQLESVFTQAANTEIAYFVFPIPNGDCNGLYIARKDKDSFEVRELGNGTSSISFDYRIVAKRRGYEEVRFEEFTEPEQPPAEPNLPVEKK